MRLTSKAIIWPDLFNSLLSLSLSYNSSRRIGVSTFRGSNEILGPRRYALGLLLMIQESRKFEASAVKATGTKEPPSEVRRLVKEAHGRRGNFHVERNVLPVSARKDERVLAGIHGCCAVVGDQLKRTLVQAGKGGERAH